MQKARFVYRYRGKGNDMKRIRYFVLGGLAVLLAVLVILFWQPLSALISDPALLEETIANAGAWAPLLFSILNIAQVVIAVIPGAPFEIAAGYLFGVLPGALLCDATMTIGSTIVFLLVRKFGMRLVQLFLTQEKIDQFAFLQDPTRAQSLFFFIFLIPGTPKDVVTYLAGLTCIPLKSWVFICFAGRFPAILLTALSGSALGEQRYGIAAAVIAVFAACYILGMRWYKKWSSRQ